jgi:hypothetical protein
MEATTATVGARVVVEVGFQGRPRLLRIHLSGPETTVFTR